MLSHFKDDDVAKTEKHCKEWLVFNRNNYNYKMIN